MAGRPSRAAASSWPIGGLCASTSPCTGSWSQPPIPSNSTTDDPRGLTLKGEVIEIRRADLHLVWGEGNFIDAKELRAALGRMAIGIGLNIQGLLTFDYWARDGERFRRVWDDGLQ